MLLELRKATTAFLSFTVLILLEATLLMSLLRLLLLLHAVRILHTAIATTLVKMVAVISHTIGLGTVPTVLLRIVLILILIVVRIAAAVATTVLLVAPTTGRLSTLVVVMRIKTY